eukprot:scaffold3653_cov124-Cylindrotheca_fusiformis.AAC.1
MIRQNRTDDQSTSVESVPINEISIRLDDDDDEDDDTDVVSRLSFGNSKSYISDLYVQKRNRRKRIQQEALEEASELYELALEEGAPKSEELFEDILRRVGLQIHESYEELIRLENERLQAAFDAEIEKENASLSQPTPSQEKVTRLNEAMRIEETRILQTNIERVLSWINKENIALKQRRRLELKHARYTVELEEQQSHHNSNQSFVIERALEQIAESTPSTEDLSESFPLIADIPEREPKQNIPLTADIPQQEPKQIAHNSPLASHKPIAGNTTLISDIPQKETNDSAAMNPETSSASVAKDSPDSKEHLYFSLEDFKSGRIDDDRVDMSKWEEYLLPSDFESNFGMSREVFEKLPKWKQKNLKRSLRTWY